MQNARSLIDLLCEAHSTPVLFHATDVCAVARMLESGTLELTFSGGTQADNLHVAKHFYLSCSRNPVNGYRKSFKGAATLVLDASKLRQRYQVTPVDYWQMQGASDEQEDRLWATTPSIPLRPSLKEIHALLAPGYEDRALVMEGFASIKTSGVPHFFYEKDNDYQTLNKRRAVELPASETTPEEVYPRSTRWVDDASRLVSFLENPLDPSLDDFYARRASRYDFYRSADAEVHNLRSDKRPVAQAVLYRISRLLRKRRARTVKELVLAAQTEREGQRAA